MTRDQAQQLSSFGKLLVLGGIVWGVSRAAPSMRTPALCVGAGAICWYMGRRGLGENAISVDASGQLGRQGREVIDVTPRRVTAPA